MLVREKSSKDKGILDNEHHEGANRVVSVVMMRVYVVGSTDMLDQALYSEQSIITKVKFMHSVLEILSYIINVINLYNDLPRSDPIVLISSLACSKNRSSSRI